MTQILIADHQFGKYGASCLDLFTRAGFMVVTNPHGRRLTPEELVMLARSCVGVVAGSEGYTAQVLDQLPALRCISRVGVGVDNVDLYAARARGIEVCTTPEAPTDAVADFTLGLILALLRGIPQMDRAVRRGAWTRQLGRRLAGTRVGLLGLGRIGRAVAIRLRALGVAVSGYDIAPAEEWAGARGVTLRPLEEVVRWAEVLSLHLSYNRDTHHLIDDRLMRLMPAGAFLVNTSRGGLVDEEALYAHLVDGHLAGAALDVFEEEPYSGRLSTLEQVILTPHAATMIPETRARMDREAVTNLLFSLRREGERSELDRQHE